MGKRNDELAAKNNLKLPINDRLPAAEQGAKQASQRLKEYARKHRLWLQGLRRESVENAVSSLIDLLDAMDASTEDLEPDNEDCCPACDDDPAWRLSDTRAGDGDDAEDSFPRTQDVQQNGFAETQERWIGRRIIDGTWTPVLIRRRVTTTEGS
jgi:hypothetical protein